MQRNRASTQDVTDTGTCLERFFKRNWTCLVAARQMELQDQGDAEESPTNIDPAQAQPSNVATGFDTKGISTFTPENEDPIVWEDIQNDVLCMQFQHRPHPGIEQTLLANGWTVITNVLKGTYWVAQLNDMAKSMTVAAYEAYRKQREDQK